MRVARFHGNADVRVENVSAPEPTGTEVEIAVETAGICGTDLHEYAEGPMGVPVDAPHPLTGQTVPVPLGHECCGVVRNVGDGAAIRPGTPVVVNPILWCDDCPYCHAGQYQLCAVGGAVGKSGRTGAFAETVVVDECQAVPIPETIPFDHGALVEPFTVALRAVREGGVSAGESVAVIGGGPIGLCIVQVARAAGASTVFVSEPRASRQAVAIECDATAVVDPTEANPVDTIRERTGVGVDVAFEVAGVGPTLSQSTQVTKKGGRTVVVSIFERDVEFDPNALVTGNRTMYGTVGYRAGPCAHQDFERTIALMEDGSLDPEALVTSRIPLDEIVESGFESLVAPETDDVKVLVHP